MIINNGEMVLIYYDANGSAHVHVTTKQHHDLYILLDKLGIKETPNKNKSSVMWSTGQYIVTSSVSYITTSIDLSIKIPQEPKPPKKFGSPDKDQRRQWRTTSTKHSRNTGRKIGRR